MLMKTSIVTVKAKSIVVVFVILAINGSDNDSGTSNRNHKKTYRF